MFDFIASTIIRAAPFYVLPSVSSTLSWVRLWVIKTFRARAKGEDVRMCCLSLANCYAGPILPVMALRK
jgi:hypothetical protein